MPTCLRSNALRTLLFSLSISVAAATSVAAFPEKPVKLIVPFSPGGGTDLVARTLGSGLAKELGQPVIIENKAGGGTIIGSDLVAKSAPDGYTLLVATFAHAVNPSLQPSLPYATDKAFTPVTLVSRGPNVLVVRASSPFKSVNEIVAAAKKAARSPEFAKKMEQEGLSIVASDPADLDRYVRAEEARWRKIVKESNIRPD